MEGTTMNTSMISEADETDDDKSVDVLTRVIKHPRVAKALNDSPLLKSMRREGLRTLQGTIEDAVQPIRKLRAVKSVADLQAVTGKHLDIKSALRDKKVDPASIETKDLNAAVADVVPNMVKQAAKPFVERLTTLRKSMAAMAQEHGVGDTEVYKTVMKLFEDGIDELTDD
jgi:hypothetical protein